MEPGKLFRNFGAAAQKAVSPNVVRVLQLEGGGGGGGCKYNSLFDRKLYLDTFLNEMRF